MKTFETEKGSIPEGATHYMNEDRHSLFTWLKVGDDIELWCDIMETWRCIGSHVNCIMDKLTPIPQTKEVEWANGDECLYGGDSGFFVGYCKCAGWVVIQRLGEIESVMVGQLSKPETPEAKKEREELEVVSEAMIAIGAEVGDRSDVEGVVLRIIKAGYARVE